MADAFRQRYLDALRGIAALYVSAFHVFGLPKLTGRLGFQLPPLMGQVVWYGKHGVILFFIVSAFSLSMTMPRHVVTGASLRSFYVARAFRIAPLFWIMLPLGCLLSWYRGYGWPDPRVVALNFSLLFNLAPKWQPSLVYAGWTVGVEILFYIVFPLLYFRARNLWIALGVLLAATAAGFAFPTTLGVVHFIPIFVLGTIAFKVANSVRKSKQSRIVGAFCIAVGILILTIDMLTSASISEIALGRVSNVDEIAHDYFGALGWMGLLIGMSAAPWSLLVNRVTCFFGKISYSYYLMHALLVMLMLPAFSEVSATIHSRSTLAYIMCLGLLSFARDADRVSDVHFCRTARHFCWSHLVPRHASLKSSICRLTAHSSGLISWSQTGRTTRSNTGDNLGRKPRRPPRSPRQIG